MASLASSAVTILDEWYEGGMNGRRNVVRKLSLVLTGQGGSTNKITASALGFQILLRTTNAIASDNDPIYLAAVSADGSYLTLAADAAASCSPGDVTDTVVVIVEGQP